MSQPKHYSRRGTPHTNFTPSPCYPSQPDKVLFSLKDALESVECPGKQLTQIQFSRMCGVNSTTMNLWLCTDRAAQIVKFLCALERLPDTQRAQLLRKLCRDCPRLTHRRLRHDAKAVAALAKLLGQPSGLTMISSPSDELRTFLLTAIGNSATMINKKLRVCGLDIHQPTSFSPVPGVLYLNQPPDTGGIRIHLSVAWPLIEKNESEVVLLNGIWSADAPLRGKLLKLAKSKNVFLADQFDNTSQRILCGTDIVVTVVTAIPHKTHSDWISFSINQAEYAREGPATTSARSTQQWWQDNALGSAPS